LIRCALAVPQSVTTLELLDFFGKDAAKLVIDLVGVFQRVAVD